MSMDCREFRKKLRRLTAAEPGEPMRRHEAACPSCALEARAARLLLLGSAVDPDAAPRPGFERRLAARLASEPLPRAIPGRNGGLELLMRPALAVAATLMLVCGGLYLGLAQPEPDDLASLVETDSILTSLNVAEPDSIFAEPDSPLTTVAP
jgi:hypothetical protein